MLAMNIGTGIAPWASVETPNLWIPGMFILVSNMSISVMWPTCDGVWFFQFGFGMKVPWSMMMIYVRGMIDRNEQLYLWGF